MDRRIKLVKPENLRQVRVEFYEALDRGDLSLCQALRQMRKLAGMTQPEFAEHRGVSVKVIREIEREIGNPTLRTLNEIGKIFGLEVGFKRIKKLDS